MTRYERIYKNMNEAQRFFKELQRISLKTPKTSKFRQDIIDVGFSNSEYNCLINGYFTDNKMAGKKTWARRKQIV